MQWLHLVFFFVLHVKSLCLQWNCTETACFAITDISMSWDDAFATCRQFDAFIISHTDLFSPEWTSLTGMKPSDNPGTIHGRNQFISLVQEGTWVSLRRYSHQFFFQSIDRIPRLYRTLAATEMNPDLYDDSLLCLTFQYEPFGQLKSTACDEKSRFICRRHPSINTTAFGDLKIQLTTPNDLSPHETCRGNEYRLRSPLFVNEANDYLVRLRCDFEGSAVFPGQINGMINGYYAGQVSVEGEFLVNNVEDFYIQSDNNDHVTATFQFQCAQWTPGGTELLLSRKILVLYGESEYEVHHLQMEINKTVETPAEFLQRIRFFGIGQTELMSLRTHIDNSFESWHLTHITSTANQDNVLKLKLLVPADANLNGLSGVSTSFCASQGGVNWKADDLFDDDRESSSPLCLNANGELITRRCECNLLDGASATFHLGGAMEELPQAECVVKQERMPLACPEGFNTNTDLGCLKIVDPASWEHAFSECFLYTDYFDDSIFTDLIKKLIPKYTEYWLYNKRWLPYTGFLGFMPPMETYHKRKRQVREDKWGEDEPKLENDCVKINSITGKKETEKCSKKLPMLCIIHPRMSSDSFIGSCQNGWSGIRKLGQKMTCIKIFPSTKDSQNQCSNGSHLAQHVLTYSKENVILYLLNGYDSSSSNKELSECAFGLSKVNGTYQWIDSSDVKKFNWKASTNFSEVNGLISVGYDEYEQQRTRWSLGNEENCIICEKERSPPVRTDIHVYETAEGSVNITVYDSLNIKGYIRCFRNMDMIREISMYILPSDGKDQYVTQLDSRPEYDSIYVCFGWSYSLKKLVTSNKYVKIVTKSSVTAAVLWEDGLRPYTPSFDPSLINEQVYTEYRNIKGFQAPQNLQQKLVRFQKSPQGTLQALYHITSTLFTPIEKYSDSLDAEYVNTEESKQSVESRHNIISRTIRSLGPNVRYVRNTAFCFGESTIVNERELTWPTTLVGNNAAPEQLCISSNGNVLSRRCSGSVIEGAYWENVTDACNGDLSTVTDDLHKLYLTKVTAENAEEVMTKTNHLTRQPEALISADVSYTAGVLKHVADSEVLKPSQISEVVSVLNNILAIDEDEIISNAQVSQNSSNLITESLERIVSNSVLKGNNGEIENNQIVYDNIAVKTVRVDSLLTVGFAIRGTGSLAYRESDISSINRGEKVNFGSMSVGIILPETVLKGNHTVSFISYRKNSFFKSTQDTFDKLLINSQVISAQVGGTSFKNLDEPVQIIFNPQRARINESEVRCGFWDFTLDGSTAGWSGAGCYFKERIDERDICECYHLTHFAELISTYGDIPEIHHQILNVITLLGCGLSILGLFCTVLSFLLLKKLQKHRGCQVLFNLSLALLAVLIIFVTGFDSKSGKVASAGCITVAVLLHYFILASFHWMLVEAVLQYLDFVKVLDSYIPRFIKKACIVAWGIPALFVIITLSISPNNYTTPQQYCWMSGYPLYLSLLLPVGIVMLANITIFILVIIRFLKKSKIRSNQDEKALALQKLKRAVMIFVLLGLSWVFGFFAVGGAKVVFSYIFCFFVTLQGFFIFLFHIAFGKTIKKGLKHFFSDMYSIFSSGKTESSMVRTSQSNNETKF